MVCHLQKNKSNIFVRYFSQKEKLPAEINVSKTCVMPNKGNRKVAALTAFLKIEIILNKIHYKPIYLTNFAFIELRRLLKQIAT